ncbi:MAG: hypothetical protein GY941_21700 [Planctomycetes bacterium]|nr:hypothetical protein [Planctomycetota bacterium]
MISAPEQKRIPTPQEVASQDSAYWARLMCIKLQRGVWDFTNHPYLVEVMQQAMLHRQGLAPALQCGMKAAQGGFSTAEILTDLHGMKYGHYPNGVLYLFPTAEDMQDFSKSRFNPMLKDNPTAIGLAVKDTNMARLKRIGDAVLYMRGATLSQKVDAADSESAKLRSISVDKVVFDEYDLMDTSVRAKAKERMGHSEVQSMTFLSNPTTPGYGISAVWGESDKRHWFRRCLRCGVEPVSGADWEWYETKANGWTCAEVQFPNNVEVGPDGKGYIACNKCGRPVGLECGGWVPKEPEFSSYMWGYHWSQLTSKFNDPFQLLKEYTNPPEGDLANVVRFRLGRPFLSAEDTLSAHQVLANCGIGQQYEQHPGPCAMGVDIRRHKNVVIGCRSSKNSWRILRVARLETMDEVLRMAYRFGVKIAVVDIRPYEDEVRQFQRTASFKTYLCEYSDNTPVGTSWNDKTGIVKVNRNEIMDASHRMITDCQIELPGLCPEIKQFASECSNVVKAEVVNKRTRQMMFRYRKLNSDKPDDYRHSLNYFIMAATTAHLPVIGSRGRGTRPSHAKNITPVM